LQWLGSFDLVLSYLHDPTGTVRENLLGAHPGQVICATPLVRNAHAADHMMKPLSELGIRAPGRAVPRLELRGAAIDRGRRLLRQVGREVVVIHPGSGSASKNWPADRFAALAERIRGETGMVPAVACGEADESVRQCLESTAPELALLPELDLAGLAGLLCACRCYVGNDSGITHIAAAVGATVVAVFGPTDPEVWGPRGANVSVLGPPAFTDRSLSAMPVHTVFSAVVRMCGGRNPVSQCPSFVSPSGDIEHCNRVRPRDRAGIRNACIRSLYVHVREHRAGSRRPEEVLLGRSGMDPAKAGTGRKPDKRGGL
jgi:hypothetical protein